MKTYSSHVTLTTEVFVLSWPGKERETDEIVAQLAPHLQSVTVLWNGSSPVKGATWIDLGEEAYFGTKFNHIRKNARADIQFVIPADCRIEDWELLVSRGHSAFSTRKNLAIWAPHTQGTAWSLSRTRLRRLSEYEFSVTAVDSLVWALKRDFLKSLPDHGFSRNRFGWGIEATVAAEAHNQGLDILLDTSLNYSHARGSAYNSNRAEQMEIDFYRSLPRRTLSTVRRIQFIFTARKQREQDRLGPTKTLKVWIQQVTLSSLRLMAFRHRKQL